MPTNWLGEGMPFAPEPSGCALLTRGELEQVDRTHHRREDHDQAEINRRSIQAPPPRGADSRARRSGTPSRSPNPNRSKPIDGEQALQVCRSQRPRQGSAWREKGCQSIAPARFDIAPQADPDRPRTGQRLPGSPLLGLSTAAGGWRARLTCQWLMTANATTSPGVILPTAGAHSVRYRGTERIHRGNLGRAQG